MWQLSVETQEILAQNAIKGQPLGKTVQETIELFQHVERTSKKFVREMKMSGTVDIGARSFRDRCRCFVDINCKSGVLKLACLNLYALPVCILKLVKGHSDFINSKFYL